MGRGKDSLISERKEKKGGKSDVKTITCYSPPKDLYRASLQATATSPQRTQFIAEHDVIWYGYME